MADQYQNSDCACHIATDELPNICIHKLAEPPQRSASYHSTAHIVLGSPHPGQVKLDALRTSSLAQLSSWWAIRKAITLTVQLTCAKHSYEDLKSSWYTDGSKQVRDDRAILIEALVFNTAREGSHTVNPRGIDCVRTFYGQ